MAVNSDIEHYYTVDGAAGDPQGDPNASLGGRRSSTTCHEFESSTTGVSSGTINFTDTTRIGDGANEHVGKFVLWLTGSNELTARRVTSFDTATGVFGFSNPWGSTPGSGDEYRVFELHSVFAETTIMQSAVGTEHHRCIVVQYLGAGSLTAVRSFLIFPDIGDTLFEIAVSQGVTLSIQTEILTDEEDEPDTSITPFNGTANGRFGRPISYEAGYGVYPDSTAFSSSFFRAIWIKMIPSANSRTREDCVAILVTEGHDGSGLVRAGMVIPFDVAGYTESVDLTPDRIAYIGGGALMRAVITGLETGLPAADRPVRWEKVSGDGTLYADEDEYTDENGLSQVTFIASDDPADGGSVTTIRVKV